MDEKLIIKTCSIAMVAAGILLVVAGALKEYYKDKLEKKQSALSGNLTSQKKSIKSDENYLITLKLGGLRCSFKKSQFVNGVLAGSCLSIENSEPVKIKYTNGKLLISTKIFDRDQKIVCEIQDNEWTINPNNFYKRNYIDEAIEIIDQYDNVVLSARVINNNEISINGIIHTVGYGYLFMYDNTSESLEYFPTAKAIIEKKSGKTIDELYRESAQKIPRLFSYKGDYLGKLENPDKGPGL